MTVFGGPKVGGKLGPLGAEVKGGVYVTITKGGEVSDYGVRASASLGATVGPVGYEAAGVEQGFSFAPAFR